MTIKAGDKIPDATLMEMTDKGPQPVSVAQLTEGKTVVLFGVPGAFTPTCSNQHLPGFLRQADAIKAKGVHTIGCVSVNDAFVMGAWGKAQGAEGRVKMLADGNGEFTKKIGLELDASGFGMGMRSRRYALIIKNGTVTFVGIDANPGEAVESGADMVLSKL